MKKTTLKEKIIFEFYNEWEQLDWRKKWNWITGTLIHIYFEYEFFGYQFQLVIFGVGFYFRYNTKKSLQYFKRLHNKTKKEFPELYK